MKKITFLFLLTLSFIQCKQPQISNSLSSQLKDEESIGGRAEYIDSPFVTAGDRAYMVGHQDGTFPDLGWHITGEMGGIWMHPIKLLDGFTTSIVENGSETCLAAADSFVNFPMANKHIYATTVSGISVERFQFVPDGTPAVAVEYTFTNAGNETREFTFSVAAFSDLRPTWLGERTNMIDTPDAAEWNAAENAWVFKDSLNTWFAAVGSSVKAASQQMGKNKCNYSPIGKGISAITNYEIEIAAGESFSLPLVISGSVNSKSEALEVNREIQKNAATLLTQKQARYRELAENSKLTIPDKKMEQTFRWIKYNTDWLIREVPGIGRGISAGIPDYPWWFGVDSEYTLQGALAIGRYDIVYETIDLIYQLSEKRNGNGRIVHEVSTNGAVFNEGNINETPQFTSLIWKVYQWTGDRQFLEKYYPTIQKGLDWLMTENDKDGNLFPDGFGMMEIHGMDSEMIDVAVYTQKAFADAAEMAKILGKQSDVKQYTELAVNLKTKINVDFWVEESNSYADFIGTKSQALLLVNDAIIRADTLQKPWAVAELKAAKKQIEQSKGAGKKGYVLHHNWVVNTPMEMGIADKDKAMKALNTAKKYVSPFGAFVTGIDRDESSETETGSFAKKMKIFTYTGAVMTLPTGVAAISENNYGRPNEALDYLNRLTTSFSYALPGSMYEVSPDFGMMTQAWNLYSYAIPIVNQFFGIRPNVAKKEITISPQMPDAWNEAKLENVKIGDNSLVMSYVKSGASAKITLNQTADWQLKLQFPKGKYTAWRVNGKAVKPMVEGELESILLNKKSNEIELR
jgi:glycogen debranching enzyme